MIFGLPYNEANGVNTELPLPDPNYCIDITEAPSIRNLSMQRLLAVVMSLWPKGFPIGVIIPQSPNQRFLEFFRNLQERG